LYTGVPGLQGTDNVGGGGDGRSTGESFLAGMGGARVAAALGGGGDGWSTGESGAKASCYSIFFRRNTKMTERFGTVGYMDMLHA
jgi:hypothetical protein